MTRYIIRRSLQSIVLLWISTLIGFTVYQLAPGGPLQFLDDDPKRAQADIDRLTRTYGLDRSVPVHMWPGPLVKIGCRPPKPGAVAAA